MIFLAYEIIHPLIQIIKSPAKGEIYQRALIIGILFLLLFLNMGELRSYCTVMFQTRKCLYLSSYSTNLNNFFLKYSLVSTLLTIKISSFLGYRHYEIFKQKRSKMCTFWRHLSTKITFCPTILIKQKRIFCTIL